MVTEQKMSLLDETVRIRISPNLLAKYWLNKLSVGKHAAHELYRKPDKNSQPFWAIVHHLEGIDAE